MKNSIEEKGFSLLELLLVLVIAVTFIIMSTRYYKSYQKTRDIGLFQASVSELMGALNQYYFMNCREAGYFSHNRDLIPDLQTAGLLKKNLYSPSWNSGGFRAEIITPPGASNFYVLRVITNMDISDADYIRGALNADKGSTSYVVWTRLPLNSRDDLSSHQWIMNQRPGQQFMPGRFTTAVNTGTGSKFWILNSSLQSFTNAKDENYATNCPN